MSHTNLRKQARQVAAALATLNRSSKRLASLSIALMRSDAARTKGAEAYTAAQPLMQGLTDDQIAERILQQAAQSVEGNHLTIAAGLLELHLASLFAVIEKWQEWKFKDPTVDTLLASPHVKTLKKYRDAIFHADLLDAKGLERVATDRAVIDWAKQASVALRSAMLTKWAYYHALTTPPKPQE